MNKEYLMWIQILAQAVDTLVNMLIDNDTNIDLGIDTEEKSSSPQMIADKICDNAAIPNRSNYGQTHLMTIDLLLWNQLRAAKGNFYVT